MIALRRCRSRLCILRRFTVFRRGAQQAELADELLQRHFVAVQVNLVVGIVERARDHAVFLGGQLEHLAHGRQALYLLLRQFLRVLLIVTLQQRGFRGHFGGHRFRNGQVDIQLLTACAIS